jgi:hypothetical protein
MKEEAWGGWKDTASSLQLREAEPALLNHQIKDKVRYFQ